MTVTIVGASLAGLRVAQALRRLGFTETITMLGDEPYRPYDRPPLSKEYLDAGPDGASGGGDAAAPPSLLSDQELEALQLDLRLSCQATGLDAAGRKVELASGERVGYDRLVIATGARARRHPLGAGPGGFLSLRTVDDATAIRAALDGHPHVVVLGGGFIGAEVAAAVRKRGLDVTMIEMLPAPMSRSLGPTVGTLLARLHEDHGVRVRLGTTVAAVRRDGGGCVAELELANGSVVPADVVIEGLGATPATGWLSDSGLDLADGIACDSDLRVLGPEGVFAAGDVARWPHDVLGETVRIEHWTNAGEHAAIAAAAIMGAPRPAAAPPYVWSDQYGHRIQVIGRPRPDDAVTVIEDGGKAGHVAVYERDGIVRGVFTIDSPRVMLMGRRAISGRLSSREFLGLIT
jgi:3-phenylpropionate/trans-cinnamate dioxygenase ferredoxin reductase subunit